MKAFLKKKLFLTANEGLAVKLFSSHCEPSKVKTELVWFGFLWCVTVVSFKRLMGMFVWELNDLFVSRDNIVSLITPKFLKASDEGIKNNVLDPAR